MSSKAIPKGEQKKTIIIIIKPMTWFSMALNRISASPNVIALLRSTMIDWKTALISGHINLIEENVKFPADLVTFTEEILNGKLHFLCSEGASLLPLIFIISMIPLTLVFRRTKQGYSFKNGESKLNNILFMEDKALWEQPK